MLLECVCGKVYKVKDEAAGVRLQCKVCGKPLTPKAADPAARVRELEAQLKAKDRELDELHAHVAELEEKSGPSLGSIAAQKISDLSADKLEKELLELRTESERKLKAKDREVAEAREAAEREGGERRKFETRLAGLEEKHAKALEEKDRTLQALDASLNSYRSKIEALQRKLDQQDSQRAADREAAEQQARQREDAVRAELEGQLADRDRLIAEGREKLEKAERDAAESLKTMKAVEATVVSSRSKMEALQKRVKDVEELRKSDREQYERQLRARDAVRARVEEAGHLAGDLTSTIDSMEAVIAGLRERVGRLKESLHAPAPASAEAPAGEPEAEAPRAAEPPAPEPASAPPKEAADLPLIAPPEDNEPAAKPKRKVGA